MSRRYKNNRLQNVLKNFPKIELSYEKTTHKKVHADMFLLIPKGKKSFLWFKTFNNQNICILMILNIRNKKILSIEKKVTSFDKSLCSGKGTILYGTVFNIRQTSCFCCENMYYYKGTNISLQNQYQKLLLINDMFLNHINQKKIFNFGLTLGTPIMSENIEDLYKKAVNVPYNIYSIQHRLLFQNKPFLNLPYKEKVDCYKIFKIKATIVNDIYELYALNNNTHESIGNAYIPDYKTSVFMNSIFRNIKENDNLDALEESDSEEEFEDTSLDKYVDLEKSEIIKCIYNSKFKGWVPLEISKDAISNKKEIILVEKKNNY